MPIVASSPIQEPLNALSTTVEIPDWGDVLNVLAKVLAFNDAFSKNNPFTYTVACSILIVNPTILTWPFKACKMILGVPISIGRWVVRALGFGNNTGIERGSFAARYQSVNYGGYIPRDSYFSDMQSFGAYRDIDEDEEGGETKIPFYARVLQIGVGVLLIRFYVLLSQA